MSSRPLSDLREFLPTPADSAGVLPYLREIVTDLREVFLTHFGTAGSLPDPSQTCERSSQPLPDLREVLPTHLEPARGPLDPTQTCRRPSRTYEKFS